MKNKTYNSINLAKVVFIYMIVIFHSRLLDGILNHGYIGVEFFFIVSGFFLCRSSEKYTTTIEYMKNRIKKLYPHYLFSLIVMVVVSLITGHYWEEEFNCVAEIFMVQNLGFTKGGVNYPCWYMSVLLWGSLAVYLMLKYIPKKIDYAVMFMLPILYFMYSYIFQDGRTEIWCAEHGVYVPLIRGLADLSLGVLVHIAYQWISEKKIYDCKILKRVIEILSAIAILLLMIYPKNLDVIIVMLMCIFIIATASIDSIGEKLGSLKISKWLSQYEYAIFLNHAVIILLFKKFIIGVAEWRVSVLLLLLIITVTTYSIVTTRLVSYFVDKLQELSSDIN